MRRRFIFERWCTSRAANGDFQNLKNLVLVEEFKHLKDDMKFYLDEKDALTLQNAARLADEYALTHKSKFHSSDRSQFHRKNGGRFGSSQQTPASDYKDKTSADKSSGKSQSKDQSTGPVCDYCKKPGH